MMGHLYERGRQITPVMAKHSLFCWRFNVSRQQYTLLTIVHFHHAGAVVSPSRVIFQGPVDGEG